MRFENEIFF
jgi:hypothetical protein